MSEPQLYQGREAKRLPIQLVVMIAFVGMMMLLIWLKLASPEFKESTKARQTAQFYLEALDKAPIDKLGAELHPDVRRSFTHETLRARYAELGIGQGVQMLQMRDEQFVKEPAQWSWRIDIKTPKEARVPLLLSVRQPSAQSIARRWRVYSLCRPDLDLKAEARKLLKNPAEMSNAADLKNFKAVPESEWKLVSTNPPTLIVPGLGQKQRLSLIWQVSPDGRLGCTYQRQSVRFVQPEVK